VNVAVIWCFLLRACELIHIFICEEENTIIMQKILGATVQNLVARATGCPVFVHQCCNEPSGCVQQRDFLTIGARELYSNILIHICLTKTHF
jgi:hypothetical protein